MADDITITVKLDDYVKMGLDSYKSGIQDAMKVINNAYNQYDYEKLGQQLKESIILQYTKTKSE